MEPRHLLQWLIDRDGLNSSSLARQIKGSGVSDRPTSQPQIHKFLCGVALEPKRATLQPVADYFRIPLDAFYNGEIAERVLSDLKSSQLGKTQASPTPAAPGAPVNQFSTAQDRRRPLPLTELLAQLGVLLDAVDGPTRKNAGRMLNSYACEPEGRASSSISLVSMLEPDALKKDTQEQQPLFSRSARQ